MTSPATTNGHVIRTRALTKRYGELRAVDGVNLEVRAGDVYGFLGANGSGKTTTVRMLLGLVLPTSGEAEVLGMPMPTARHSVLPASLTRREPGRLPAPVRLRKSRIA
jgi:ABC-2 type transport system ATP-binding protein